MIALHFLQVDVTAADGRFTCGSVNYLLQRGPDDHLGKTGHSFVVLRAEFTASCAIILGTRDPEANNCWWDSVYVIALAGDGANAHPLLLHNQPSAVLPAQFSSRAALWSEPAVEITVLAGKVILVCTRVPIAGRTGTWEVSSVWYSSNEEAAEYVDQVVGPEKKDFARRALTTPPQKTLTSDEGAPVFFVLSDYRTV